jgi:hypothetical protein
LLGCAAAAAAAAAACPVAKCQQTKIDLVFLSSAPFALIAHRRVFHMLNNNFWTRAFYIIIRRFLFCFFFSFTPAPASHTLCRICTSCEKHTVENSLDSVNIALRDSYYGRSLIDAGPIGNWITFGCIFNHYVTVGY